MIYNDFLKLMQEDTLQCSLQGIQLREYQMKQHGWSDEKWAIHIKLYDKHLNP